MKQHALRLLPLLVLAGALGITWLSWQHEQRNAARDQQAALDYALRASAARISQGMAAYEKMLRGAQGLFAAMDSVPPQAFRAYVDALRLDADFSGIEGIGVMPLVPHAAREAHVAQMRARGLAGYAIRPEGERALYAPLTQIEPLSPGTMLRLGFDPYADPVRRLALERARDADAPFITEKILIDTESGPQPGFVMYLPLYANNARHDTPAARRVALVGWVSAVFHMDKLMAGLYGEQVSADIRIYDGVEAAPAALLHASIRHADHRAAAAPRRVEYIEVGGRSWTLELRAVPQHELPLDKNLSSLIAVTGIGSSLLLAALTWSLVSSRQRAYGLATEMTAALRASEARYRHLAQHDALTGLPNLALFSDRLQQALIQARRNHSMLAVLFLDLDNFKPINDALGHQVGDRLLQAVARRLRECVRESDTVARIGGDEFVLLLPVLHETPEALSLAELLRDALGLPFSMSDGRQLRISSSIGVAVYPAHGGDAAQLLKNADQAMYEAKRRGRNEVCLFDPETAS